jgi:septal ring factor EnvC (AmiA/AmiB activator)
MGLFFNRKNHTDVYKGKSIDEKNQAIYRSDSLSEAMLEQQRAFETMNEKYSEMEKQLQKQRRIQSDRWETTGMRFEEIMDFHTQHRQFEQEAIDTLMNLERKHTELQKVLDNKRKANEELVEQINMLSQSNAEIAERLDKFDADQEKLLTKMDAQLEKQDQFSLSLEEQRTVQTEIVERIEQHEGLLEKMMRQLDFLKSVIFERSHFIAEKIDKSYQLTTTYMSNVRGKSNSESN